MFTYYSQNYARTIGAGLAQSFAAKLLQIIHLHNHIFYTFPHEGT